MSGGFVATSRTQTFVTTFLQAAIQAHLTTSALYQLWQRHSAASWCGGGATRCEKSTDAVGVCKVTPRFQLYSWYIVGITSLQLCFYDRVINQILKWLLIDEYEQIELGNNRLKSQVKSRQVTSSHVCAARMRNPRAPRGRARQIVGHVDRSRQLGLACLGGLRRCSLEV